MRPAVINYKQATVMAMSFVLRKIFIIYITFIRYKYVTFFGFIMGLEIYKNLILGKRIYDVELHCILPDK